MNKQDIQDCDVALIYFEIQQMLSELGLPCQTLEQVVEAESKLAEDQMRSVDSVDFLGPTLF